MIKQIPDFIPIFLFDIFKPPGYCIAVVGFLSFRKYRLVVTDACLFKAINKYVTDLSYAFVVEIKPIYIPRNTAQALGVHVCVLNNL
jgi:hypothetical protein